MKIQYLEYGKNGFNNRYNKNKKVRGKLRLFLYILLALAIIVAITFTILSFRYGPSNVINKGFSVINNITTPITTKITLLVNNITGKNDIDYNIETTSSYLFVNNVKRENISLNALSKNSDVKIILESEKYDRLVNYPEGYYINLPKNLSYDFSLSTNIAQAYNDKIDITISLERSPYPDVWEYIDYYQNRFILNENYQQKNNISLINNSKTNINGNDVQIISLSRNTDNVKTLNNYTYMYMKLNGQNYLRIMIKSLQYNDELISQYTEMLNSFTQIEPQFENKNNIEFFPITNSNWNEDTKALYNQLNTSNNISWGIFAADIANEGLNVTIPNIEKELDYKFDVILMYNHLGTPLPLDAMKKVSEEKRIIELTVQTCYANNVQLFDYTPMFDIIDGKLDNQIRTLANEIKSLNTPVLFRLNNEMNTDWTSYSGIINLCDPDIYINVWHHIYNIFEEENVQNCIWIFNPNDNNYPPSKWNDFLNYYPGNEYVQLLGVTGYNPGTYYADKNGEQWKTFEYIYDEIYNKYNNIFSSFPWMITEFASSSIGGDKVKWITDMFEHIHKYNNIKIAVWFSAADYDENGIAARPYWLDETKETLQAFKSGIHKE